MSGCFREYWEQNGGLVDYDRAINERTFAYALQLWDGDGSASVQSFEQFQEGYRRTLSVHLLLGAVQRPDPADRSARVAVALLAVESDLSAPGTGERVRLFH